VPVKLIDGNEREELLKSQGLDKAAAKEPLRYVTLACNRRLTSAAKVQLVYGKGVSYAQRRAQFRREALQLPGARAFLRFNFTCERENAQAACLPMRPMSLELQRAGAAQAGRGASASRATRTRSNPRFEDGNTDGDNVVTGLSFKPIFPEQAQFSLELPKATSRTPLAARCATPTAFPLKVATGAMPPLAKFAASPFGIVERYRRAQHQARRPGPAARHAAQCGSPAAQVKGLVPGAPAGKVSDLQPRTDADIIAWFRKVQRYDDYQVSRKRLQPTSRAPCPSRWSRRTGTMCSRAWCRCWAARPA
jgi:hypothetical protein